MGWGVVGTVWSTACVVRWRAMYWELKETAGSWVLTIGILYCLITWCRYLKADYTRPWVVMPELIPPPPPPLTLPPPPPPPPKHGIPFSAHVNMFSSIFLSHGQSFPFWSPKVFSEITDNYIQSLGFWLSCRSTVIYSSSQGFLQCSWSTDPAGVHPIPPSSFNVFYHVNVLFKN